MEKRRYGKTNISLSIIGFGGIVVRNETPASAANIVSKAVEKGINYFDVAPTYGNAEELLGPALHPYRDLVFLACKTGKRDRIGATKDLHSSLEILQTDYLDLYQFHGVKNMEQVEQIVAEGGALEAFIQAKNEGLVKYLGFSAHSEEAAIALLDQYEFDSILFPINWVCWYKNNFGPRLVEKAKKKGTPILAIKSLAKRKWLKNEKRSWPKCWYAPVETPEEVSLALRFTLMKNVVAAVSPSDPTLLWWACEAAEKISNLKREEEELLIKRSENLQPIFPLDN